MYGKIAAEYRLVKDGCRFNGWVDGCRRENKIVLWIFNLSNTNKCPLRQSYFVKTL